MNQDQDFDPEALLPILTRYLRARGMSASDADDLTQDVLLDLLMLKAAGKSIASPISLAVMIARRRMARRWRRRETSRKALRRIGESQGERLGIYEPSTSFSPDSLHARRALYRAIAEILDDKERDVLLATAAGESLRQIAHTRKTPLHAVRMNLKRARAKMSAAIQRFPEILNLLF